MTSKENVAAPHEVWESKGRGIAVFRCQSDLPFANVRALPGTAVFTPATPTPVLVEGISRVILKDYPERFFFQRDELQALINGVVLPAFRQRVPLYFFTECTRDFFSAGELPFGNQTALTESLRLLAREQLAALLAQMCILFSSPDAIIEADGLPMTPIERQLSKAMAQLGLPFTAQVPLGPYLADFTLAAPNGQVLVVEADGRDYHDATRDSVRDAALVAHHGVAAVLRFSGSRIWHSPKNCAQQVAMRLRDLSTIPNPLASPDPLPLLSPEQDGCLHPHDGVVLTLAPAGSGKTRVLTRRVVEAVRAGVPQERVLCVVYNKLAELEMKKRIHQDHSLPNVEIRTLHSLGFEIARKSPGSPYTNFSLLDEEAVLTTLFRDAIKRDNEQQVRLGIRPRRRQTFVSDGLVEAYREYVGVFKKTLQVVGAPMDMDAEAVDDFDTAQAARVHASVEEVLQRQHKMTFDDMIYKGVEVILSSPSTRTRYQQRFDVVLVDEFQDLTPVQFLFVRLLALPFNNLFCVGDDDQMIYSFTGADPRNLRDFSTLFRSAVVHTLGENHRCAPTIVRHSANAISYNLDRFPKNIRPSLVNGKVKAEAADAYRVFVGESPDAEAREGAAAIRRWHDAGVDWKDIAVLVRVKNIAAFIQVAMKAAGIPFVPLGGANFFNSRVGKVVGAYLNVIRDVDAVHPEHLELALGNPSRFVPRDDLRRACEDGFTDLSTSDHVPSFAQANVQSFCASVRRVHAYSRSQNASAGDVMTMLTRQFDLTEHYKKMDQSTANTGASAATEVLTLIAQLTAGHSTFDGFVDWFNAQATEEIEASRTRNADNDADKVRVETIHRTKGGEFRAVVLFHVAEGTLPHSQSLGTGQPAAVEEERRIFYVGLTRAIERLLVTTDNNRISRFIKELDEPRAEPKPLIPSRNGQRQSADSATPRNGDSPTGAIPQAPSLLGSIWRFLTDLFH